MRSFVFATVFLALMLLAAVCPPATQAAPATLTVNFEIVNPPDFWATPLKNTAYAHGHGNRAASGITCEVFNEKPCSLTPYVNSATITTSSEAGSEVMIWTLFQFGSIRSNFLDTGAFKVINNGQTVTVKISVPHHASRIKPPADATMKLEQSQ